ncbi:signal transduction histidine kinase [Sphingobium wenxiniae]|uniref:histidine kinase n=2 Tax=Sphingobium TaxID=165695 RepID=T0HF97_9SPHN|nr:MULTISPECIES: PAS domain-containing sensor histidine kinase [Sphingobium]EQA98079.1 histidine kinase [Sphingobium baderi LL03]KMS63705.1 histidine kinase [Sphingobium baderi LL03]MBB6190217.1 signal transduction histidine kinase [Sphingobium wenxiniae]TWH97468.1 PAS/PAC sensor signal transduction histidine kinase [Sphingobium wenxiniae]WRD77477.1 PAS-domain containing protein [Sphingobium baderi]
MTPLTPLAAVLLGAVLAAWLAAAIWALRNGYHMRREGTQAQGQFDRLSVLLASAPAAPVIIHADGHLEASDRLAKWLGKDRIPAFLSELIAEDGGLEPGDAAALGREIAAAQRAGKSFALPIRGVGSTRLLLVRGAPAGPALASSGGVVLWIFDATDSQTEIETLKDTVEQLRDALQAMAGLVEAAPFPMWHRTPDMRLSLVNAAYVHAVDASSARDVIENGTELVETAGGITPQDAAAEAMAEGAPVARMIPATIDGERRTMRVVDVPLGAAGVAGFAMDQHELEQARVEHRRLEAAQRDLLDRLSAGVARFGPDRALRFWNQPFISLFGLDQDRLGDGPLFERVLDQMRDARRVPEHRDFPAWRSERREWFLSPDPLEENWLLADGTHLRVYAQPLPDGGLLLIFEDRTEQVQLSSARDTLLRVRTATFDNLFESIGVFSSDGRLRLWNSRFQTTWGLPEEMLAAHPRIDELMQAVQSRLAKPQQVNLVRELVRAATVERKQRMGHVGFADGHIFEFAAIPLPDGNALFTMLDVTDSRRVEQILRDRNEALEQADKVKTAFVANMSYELRTPLTTISGFAQMMSAGYAGDLSEAAKDYVDGILQSTSRLSMMIDNVLDLTQGEAGTLSIEQAPVDLTALARESAERIGQAARAKGIDLAISLQDTLGTVQGDARRIGQALDHLLENAVLYCGKGARVLLHGDGGADKARLVVSDNGPGIAPKRQATIFDPAARSEQARNGGKAGIGLPLARQLTEAHGGTFQLVSEPGQGTMAVMELPRG